MSSPDKTPCSTSVWVAVVLVATAALAGGISPALLKYGELREVPSCRPITPNMPNHRTAVRFRTAPADPGQPCIPGDFVNGRKT